MIPGIPRNLSNGNLHFVSSITCHMHTRISQDFYKLALEKNGRLVAMGNTWVTLKTRPAIDNMATSLQTCWHLSATPDSMQSATARNTQYHWSNNEKTHGIVILASFAHKMPWSMQKLDLLKWTSDLARGKGSQTCSFLYAKPLIAHTLGVQMHLVFVKFE